LSLTVKDEGYKEIDFLWAIVGVNTDQVKTRAVEMRLSGLSRGVKIVSTRGTASLRATT
jgi:hypothetical protein